MNARGIILIGASTGAPRSHHEYLRNAPRTLPAPIVIVQHLPAGPFVHGIMRYLHERAGVPCRLLSEGTALMPRTAYLVEPGRELRFEPGSGRVRVEPSTPGRPFSPAMDIAFASAAAAFGGAVAVGMIAGLHATIDGLAGCAAVRRRGGVVIASTRETTSCYSMIAQLRDAGQVDAEAPLPELLDALWNAVASTV